MEGQKGAAAAALSMLKRNWKTDPAVGFNKQQDVVHRVIGPPGIVLVGEGDSPARLRTLMTSERKKHERVLGDVPVSEVVCGRGDGEVPLPKLVKHIQKMDKKVKPAELTDVRARIKAVDAARGAVPLPQGPGPTSMKGMPRQHARPAEPSPTGPPPRFPTSGPPSSARGPQPAPATSASEPSARDQLTKLPTRKYSVSAWMATCSRRDDSSGQRSRPLAAITMLAAVTSPARPRRGSRAAPWVRAAARP